MSHGIFVWSKLGATISDATKRLPVYFFFSLVNRLTIDDLTIDRWRERDGGIFLLLFLSFFLAEFEPVLGPISFFLISISIFFSSLFWLSSGPGAYFSIIPTLSTASNYFKTSFWPRESKSRTGD